MRNIEEINLFKDQSTWKLVGLALVTWGVYVAYYINRKTKVLNQLVLEEDSISKGFTNFVFIISYISLALLIPFLIVDEGHIVEKINNKVDFIWSITIIIWAFKARNRMNKIFSFEKDGTKWFHGLWTFLFGPFYFNYRVNSIIESTTEQGAAEGSR